MDKWLIGLLGAGEFEPWSDEVDSALLDRARPGKVFILPTASAPEGDGVFQTWAAKGLAHYQRLGLDAEVLPLKTRSDAEDERLCARLEHAGLVFFSGGNPAYLADSIRGSRFWDALIRAMAGGAAFAGCSAGAMLLGEGALDSSAEAFTSAAWRPGIGLLAGTWVGPHWDVLDTEIPGLREFVVESVPKDHRLLTIDEMTSVVGDGQAWTVIGRGSVGLRRNGGLQAFRARQSFSFSP
ncbi:MAG TPA: Type 1 glutamine amidotransferase-like domain-containing protein [Dehalococcoidia bacterium]|jgi:cyanophycinase